MNGRLIPTLEELATWRQELYDAINALDVGQMNDVNALQNGMVAGLAVRFLGQLDKIAADYERTDAA